MLKLAFTRPGVISTSPKTFLTGRIDFTVLLIRIPQKGSAFTSPIAKSTSPGLLDTTFFARCSKVSSGKPFTCGMLQYLVLTEQDINSYKTSILIYYMKETWKYALNLHKIDIFPQMTVLAKLFKIPTSRKGNFLMWTQVSVLCLGVYVGYCNVSKID